MNEILSLEFLKSFCGGGWERPGISKPFLVGESVIVTDGRICLRFDKGLYPSVRQNLAAPTLAGVEALGWNHAEIKQWERFDSFFPPCLTCSGTGRHICSCGNEHDCHVCDGRKSLSIIGGEVAPGKSNCIGGVKLSERYLRLIASLPNAEMELRPDKSDSPLAFKFTSGIGLIMGVKSHE